jgi:hypothetical protein
LRLPPRVIARHTGMVAPGGIRSDTRNRA